MCTSSGSFNHILGGGWIPPGRRHFWGIDFSELAVDILNLSDAATGYLYRGNLLSTISCLPDVYNHFCDCIATSKHALFFSNNEV